MSRCFSLCEYDDESGEWVGLNHESQDSVRLMALEQQPEYTALQNAAELALEALDSRWSTYGRANDKEIAARKALLSALSTHNEQGERPPRQAD